MFIPSQAYLLAALDAIKASVFVAGPGLVVVKLAKGAFAPTPTVDPTTFTEADYAGYASKTVAAWSPSVMTVGSAETLGTTVLSFSPTGTAPTNTITGYWLENTAGDYLGGEVFNPAVPLTGPTTALNLVVKFQENSGDWASAVIP